VECAVCGVCGMCHARICHLQTGARNTLIIALCTPGRTTA
jgi:hypothetical protein